VETIVLIEAREEGGLGRGGLAGVERKPPKAVFSRGKKFFPPRVAPPADYLTNRGCLVEAFPGGGVSRDLWLSHAVRGYGLLRNLRATTVEPH